MENEQLAKQKNDELREIMKIWIEEVFKPYYEGESKNYRNEKNVDLSCPFYFALSDKYVQRENGKKRLMIVGQEPRGFGSWSKDKEKPGYEEETSQEWAQTFLDAQLEKTTKKCSFNNDKDEPYKCEPLYSPFWNFFRKLSENFVVCWNDVDKVYFTNGVNTDREDNSDETDHKKDYSKGTLTYKAETYLSEAFEYNGENKSLLEREIKIADPDAIVFAIGSSYAVSLDVALGITDKEFTGLKESNLKKKSVSVSELFREYPTRENFIVENDLLIDAVKKILGRKIPVFWTYHPACLQRSKKLDCVVEEIKQSAVKNV